MQIRALLTYIRRIYYPFLPRDPRDVQRVGDTTCLLWLYLHGSQSILGAAVVISALEQLPDALTAVDQAATASGEHNC